MIGKSVITLLNHSAENNHDLINDANITYAINTPKVIYNAVPCLLIASPGNGLI